MDSHLQQKIDDILQEINENFRRNALGKQESNLTEEEEQKLASNILFKVSTYFIELTDLCLSRVSVEERESIKSKLLINKENIQALFNKRCNKEKKMAFASVRLPSQPKQPAISSPPSPKRALPHELIQSMKLNKPKHPVSSFFFFFKEKSKEIALLHNQKVGSRVAKLVADIWKSMPEEEKQPFQKMAGETRSKYDEEMKVFKQEYAEQIAEIKRFKQEHKKLRKGSNKPEPPIYYVKNEPLPSKMQRQKAESSSDTDSEADMLSDSQASNSNEADVISDDSPPFQKQSNSQALASLEQQLQKKPKGPISSFFIYYRENCKRLSEEYNTCLGPKMIRIASEVWRGLPESEKRPYSVKAETTRKKYYEEMNRYKTENAEELRLYRRMKQEIRRGNKAGKEEK